MTAHTEGLPEGTHPAPERRKAGLASLVIGLAVPPLAWCAQSVVGYGIASHACFPGDSPLPDPTFSYLRPMLWAFNAAALVSAIVGLLDCRPKLVGDPARARWKFHAPD